MRIEYILPTFLIFVDILAACVYVAKIDYFHAGYWL